MNNLKEAILERLINCGKQNKGLKTPVMILITLFLVLFHGIRNFFMQFKLHPFRRRVLAGALCVCLLVSSMPATDYALPVLAAENSEEVQENVQEEIQESTHDGIREIVSFTELPDEVKEQTVAVGTPLESLELPDTLTVVCRMANEKNLEDNPDPDKEQDSEEKDEQPDEGKKENPEEDSDEGAGDESGDSDNEDEGKEDESGDSGSEEEGNENESGDSDNEGEGAGDESGDFDNEGERAENKFGDSDNEGEGKGEAVEKQETFTFTLPEYYAMPNELPEIKELFYEETVTIDGITWESQPEYDSEMEGVYLLTPVISDGLYTFSEDVRRPEISVTVAEPEIMLAEEELPDVSGSTTPVCGVISSDTNWEAGTLSDGELIIKPGVVLKMNGRIDINGNVTIKGGGTIRRGSGVAYINVGDSSNVTISNITIDGASISSGNSMIFSDGNFTICDGCIIRNCMSNGSGGAIYNFGGSLTIRDAIISDCSAYIGGAIESGAGGWIMDSRSVLTMENIAITNCSADYYGGAIDNSGSSAILENITIENCFATNAGGAIHTSTRNVGGTLYESDLTIKDGKFINNKTTSVKIDNNVYGGGCIWARGGTLNIYGGEFIGNTSVYRGGCIYQDTLSKDTVINISGGYFEGNICTNSGYEGSGAVYTSGIDEQLILSSDVQFYGDNVYGTDGIMLDNMRKILISDTLNYPATVYVKASDGRVIAEGTDGYKLSLEKDIKKIKFVDIGNSGEKYYTVLDEANNQIKLSRIDPGYGYSITYISNGAQGQVVDDTKYEEGDTITVRPADGLSWEGYRFTGWNTKADGSGTTYQPGDTIEGIEEDITLYAQWKVDGAEYIVEHYLQDVSGDGYTRAEADTEVLGGNVGEEVSAKPKTYRGFTENTTHASRKESGVVASDGSLILRLYYDRDIYNIAFDLNGGTGTTPEAQELRYGALLKEVSRPKKTGYTFWGWYMGESGTEGKAWDFAKTVEENTENKSEILYAGWLETSIAQGSTAHGNKTPDANNNSPTLNSPTSASGQFIVSASATWPLKTSNPARDNVPRTGDTSYVEVYATIAMVSGLLSVLLYFTMDRNGMTQEEKEQFLSCLISWAKRGGKLRKLLATAVIFLFLVYYHSIGKCVAYDEKEIRV